MKNKFFIISVLTLSMSILTEFKVTAMEKNNIIKIDASTKKMKDKSKNSLEKSQSKNKKDFEKIKDNKLKNNHFKKEPKSLVPPLNLNEESEKKIEDHSESENYISGLTEEEKEYNIRYFKNKEETKNKKCRIYSDIKKDSLKDSTERENKEDEWYDTILSYEIEIKENNLNINNFKNYIKNLVVKDKDKNISQKLKNSKILKNIEEDFQKSACAIDEILKILRGILKDKDFNYFEKSKMQGIFKKLVKTIVKNANALNIYQSLNQNNKIGIDDYIKLQQSGMIEKYKDNIIFNIDRLKLSIEEQLNFILEIQYICNILVKYYKDFFYYKEQIRSYEEEGYLFKYFVRKLKNGFIVYEDEETKINVIYAPKGKRLKHFIYFRNPAESVLNVVEKVKKNMNNNSVEIYVDNNGGLRIVYDDLNEDFLRKIYPCVKQQYYENSKDIIFFIKDVTLDSDAVPEEFSHYDSKRFRMFKILKDNMFLKLYNDEYEIKYIENEEKTDLNSKKRSNKVLYNLKEIRDKKIFHDDEEDFKYVAKVKYFLNCLARFKDIFNMNSAFLKEKFKKLLSSYEFYDFVIKPQNEEDCFEIKFCGYDKFFENKEKLISKINGFMNKFVEILTKQNGFNCYNDLYDSNNTICLYKSYLNNADKITNYFTERDYRGKYKDNELQVLKNVISKFTKVNKASDDENSIIMAATLPVDWSEKYRGSIPFMDLITKSFSKYGEPFSDKVIDRKDHFIEDYVLRVYENLVDGINVLEETVNNNMVSIEVFKNLDY